MSDIANRRAYLLASHRLATSAQPTNDMVLAACETFAATLSDIQGERVFIIPLSRKEAELLVDLAATVQDKKGDTHG